MQEDKQFLKEFRSISQTATIDALEGIIEGYPIVFEQKTKIGDEFIEVIDAHALDDADLSDIKLMINHDNQMIPLARHRRGKRSTMDIVIDEKGMNIKARLDKDGNEDARKILSAVTRGDIEEMSFAFGITVAGEEWENLNSELPIRRIKKIGKVFEVSAVNDAAYPQTSIYARSADALENEKRALENARAAALENENRVKQEQAVAALRLQKQKFIFMEELKK